MAPQRAAKALLKRHPLQRFESPSRGASALLHAVSLASFAYSFSYLVRHPNTASESYGWHLQFLTIIGLSLATATFVVGLMADLTLSATLFKIKTTLSVASAPMEVLISLLYWGLRAVNPKLVVPDWMPPLALHADISFHAVPSIALVADLLFFSPPYAIAILPALALSNTIAFGYWVWIEQCYARNNFYPYPIFGILNTQQRVGLFAGSAVLMTLSTGILIRLYALVNGKEVQELANGDQKGDLTGHLKGAKSGNFKGE